MNLLASCINIEHNSTGYGYLNVISRQAVSQLRRQSERGPERVKRNKGSCIYTNWGENQTTHFLLQVAGRRFRHAPSSWRGIRLPPDATNVSLRRISKGGSEIIKRQTSHVLVWLIIPERGRGKMSAREPVPADHGKSGGAGQTTLILFPLRFLGNSRCGPAAGNDTGQR